MTEGQPVGAVTDKWKSRVSLPESEENKGDPALKPGKSFVGGRIADAKPAAKKGELAQERKGGESAKNQSGDEEAQTQPVGEEGASQIALGFAVHDALNGTNVPARNQSAPWRAG